MELLTVFPLLTACFLYRIGILSIWICAAIATLSPALASISGTWAGQARLGRSILNFGLTSATVYSVAVAFLLLMPSINLLIYCLLFCMTTYAAMFLCVFQLEKISRSDSSEGNPNA